MPFAVRRTASGLDDCSGGRGSRGGFGRWALALLVCLAPGGQAQAGPTAVSVKATFSSRGARPVPGSQAGTTARGITGGRKGKTPPARDAPNFLFQRPASVVPNQQGKVVLFAFRNDDRNALAAQVGQLLELRGLEVVTGVRPVDSAEQYRDVATHLGLAAFVDGEVRGTDAKTAVTVRVRSGFSGRPLSKATFVDSRQNLPRTLSDNLWKKVGAVMAHACLDASKPRKPSRGALRINAGTPL